MAFSDRDVSDEHPALLEVAGVAGAGKSTLARALCDEDPRCRRAEFIHTRTPAHVWEVVLAIPHIAPILVESLGRPRLSWPEFKLLVYVTRWQHLLERRPAYRGRVAVLDQGPLYALVRLRAQKPELWARPRAERWWTQILDRWLSALDVLVWLDAPDDILWDRINGRKQSHTTKGQPYVEALAFLGRYRTSFTEILDRAEAAGRPVVLRYDTASISPRAIAELIAPVMPDAPMTEGLLDAG